MLLLPESATGADIESARKLLIDRGSSDGTTSSSIALYFYGRSDIVEFNSINVSSATSLRFTWFSCSSLNSFPPLDIRNGNDFTSAWSGTSSLQSFPSGAKLGTAASSGVNFTSAWQSSGLTSFSTPLPTAGSLVAAFRSATGLASFNSELPSVTSMYLAFDGCGALTDFAEGLFDNWNPSSISNGVFNNTWAGCNLTAQSVENILVSIDASGKYGTATGASGGGSIDSGIDIDYNTATGSLSAATNAAVTSLKAKGWSIIVNNVTL